MKIIFIYLLVSSALFAASPKDLDLKNFVKKGEALIEVTIFKIDVYIASYFENAAGNEQALELSYQIDVEKKHSVEGWTEGFKPLDKEKYKGAIQWVNDQTADMKKGDRFIIWKNGDLVRFYHNDKLSSEIRDKLVSEIVMFPWIGNEPLDKKVKKKLLGKK